MDNQLIERIVNCNDLPSIPAAVKKVIQLSNKSGVSHTEVVEAIHGDTNLVAQMLRMANSAFYGFQSEVNSLHEAVVLVGTRASLTLSLSFLVMKIVNNAKRPDSTIDYNHYWQRSIVAAVSAREIGKELGLPDAEGLFLAGLLQDIGILILDVTHPVEYSKSIYKMQNDHHLLTTVEKRIYGSDHAEIGAFMLDLWSIPPQIVEAVKQSNNANIENDFDAALFIKITNASGHIADAWLNRSDGLDSMPAQVALGEIFHEMPMKIEKLLQQFITSVTNAAEIFEQPDLRLNDEEQQAIIEQAMLLYQQYKLSLPAGHIERHTPSP